MSSKTSSCVTPTVVGRLAALPALITPPPPLPRPPEVHRRCPVVVLDGALHHRDIVIWISLSPQSTSSSVSLLSCCKVRVVCVGVTCGREIKKTSSLLVDTLTSPLHVLYIIPAQLNKPKTMKYWCFAVLHHYLCSQFSFLCSASQLTLLQASEVEYNRSRETMRTLRCDGSSVCSITGEGRQSEVVIGNRRENTMTSEVSW